MSLVGKIIGVVNSVFGLTISGANLTSTQKLTVPGGAPSAPSVNFAGDLTTGLYSRTASMVDVVQAGTARYEFGTTGMSVDRGRQIGFLPAGNVGQVADDTCLSSPAAAVLRVTDTSGTTPGRIQDTAGKQRRTATQTVTDSTTFAADNTLSATVISGRRYDFEIGYFFTTVNTSGVKVDLNGGGATVAAINGMITIYSSAMAVLAAAQITALTSTAGITASGTFAYAVIKGSFEASSNGTFAPRFAQNAETGAAESVIAQIGSYMITEDTP